MNLIRGHSNQNRIPAEDSVATFPLGLSSIRALSQKHYRSSNSGSHDSQKKRQFARQTPSEDEQSRGSPRYRLANIYGAEGMDSVVTCDSNHASTHPLFHPLTHAFTRSHL